MELDGKKVAILVEDMFNIQEFWYPYYRLQEAGAQVVVAGNEKGKEYAGKGGTSIPADVNAADLDAADFDAVVVPGGYAPDLMRRHSGMVDFVKNMNAAGKVVAAICHAGWLLASADVFRGRKATSFFAIKDDVANAGAEWVDQEVVVDGNLVTSRTPDDLPIFLKNIISALQ